MDIKCVGNWCSACHITPVRKLGSGYFLMFFFQFLHVGVRGKSENSRKCLINMLISEKSYSDNFCSFILKMLKFQC